MKPPFLATVWAVLASMPGAAQTFESPASLEPAVMATLARQVLLEAKDTEGEKALDQIFRLRMVVQDFPGALEAIQALQASRKGNEPLHATATRQHELYARTRLLDLAGKESGPALAEAFAAMAKNMDDRTAYQFRLALRSNSAGAEQGLQKTFGPLTNKRRLSKAEALDLLLAFETKEVAARLEPGAVALMAQEEDRRYLIDEHVQIRTRDGATLCATLVRPRKVTGKLPTAFEFTIYTNAMNRSEALRSASEGYAGLVANARGKRESLDAIVPYEHDGADAAEVIDWACGQPWSDGQVGMFGGSYDGFAQWAAAKHAPKGLRSIMPSVPGAPGIDSPMEGGIFQNFQYRWIPYVTNHRLLDEADYNDRGRWNGLDWSWFESGRPYRDLPAVDGKPNPLWLRWLSHPTYDAYWQAMTPQGEEFARLAMPVLTTTGYYDGCSLSALHYFTEHTTRRKDAEHYLVIGPYDHIGGQRRSQDVLLGHRIDEAARIDFEALRYQWLDYTLRGGPKPARLKDRVNYQVMGANQWKAAPSVASMTNGALKRYLTPTKAGGAFQLTEVPSKGVTFSQVVDLKDRTVVQFGTPAQIQDKSLDSTHGFTFATEPLEAPLELSGCFSGELRFTTNKRDVDLALSLYELTAEGDYLLLSTYLGRASWRKDRITRQLLSPGKATVLPFRSGRLISRRLGKGSRLVFLLSVPLSPRMQVNLGSGKDVSDESASDARVPLRITWRADSFVVLPIWR